MVEVRRQRRDGLDLRLVDRREQQQQLAFVDEVPRGHAQRADTSCAVQMDAMLHLHGFEHQHFGACGQRLADLCVELHQTARHGCAQADLPFGYRCRGRGGQRRCHRAWLGAVGLGFDLRAQRRPLRLDPAGVDLAVLHFGVCGQRAQQRQVGRQPGDLAFGQRTLRAPQHRVEMPAAVADDQLGQQAVVVRRRCCTVASMAVDPDPGAAGQLAARDLAAGRPGLALRVQALGIDSPLHREAAGLRRVRRVQADAGQRAAGGDRNLRLHQVDAGHFLGHGVFDLQPRVGFDEDERQVSGLIVDQKFESAQALVTGAAGQCQRGLKHLLAQRGVQVGAGRDLDQLLESALQRALALAQRHHLAAVAYHLDF